MRKKMIVIGILLVFTGIMLAPCTTSDGTRPAPRTTSGCPLILLDEPGTLSGYVTDTEMSPIQGAHIRVDFHDTYRENYSDATGYYHVTDIPLCYCMKNVTCSKPGYIPASVSLTITENTTYDFILASTGPWLYVGGNGLENYTRIQDAIDNASNGDIVFVYDDSSPYQEKLIVDKSIILCGETKETTVIDGGSVTILILADDVVVSGFTITNSQWLYGIHRAGIYILSNRTLIFDNIITHVWEGVACGWFNRSINHITIERNKIDYVKGQGLSFVNTKFVTISNNTINNTFSSGININNASENSIIQNSIQNISDGHGIQGWDTDGCQIVRNTIQNGEMNGIMLIDSTNAIISSNVIIAMSESGISSERSIVISNNTVDSCDNYGIIVSGDHCNLTGNRVINNRIGMFLSEGSNCIITSNIIKQNEHGLNLAGTPYTTVSQNNFLDNENDANFTSLITTIIGVFTCIGTRFQQNYWSNTRFFPKIIPGTIYFTRDGQNFTRFPLFKIDMHPAQEPYDIGGIIK
ncbi:MAG TPA: right-handed parallel beta-helix repeat-containing protein [Candidatus Thermoplasmatota archaeon]|nr:right-handed parallel beta-helix repeat-containing protein [Candidatus Thermoplasmatota archaeon]